MTRDELWRVYWNETKKLASMIDEDMPTGVLKAQANLLIKIRDELQSYYESFQDWDRIREAVKANGGPDGISLEPGKKSPPKYIQVIEWYKSNPKGTRMQCARELGLTKGYINVVANRYKLVTEPTRRGRPKKQK